MDDPILERQLIKELNVALSGLAPPVRELLIGQAGALASQLSGGDPAVAGPTARRLLQTIWPRRSADPAWWGTPLGRAVALCYPPEEVIARGEAAALLGTSRSRVDRLVEEGVLEGGVAEGVSRSSVLRRLADTAPTEPVVADPVRGREGPGLPG